jgi:mRNA interferase YafQ
MRTISRTSRFKKDYKREARGRHRAALDADLLAAFRSWLRIAFCRRSSTIIR